MVNSWTKWNFKENESDLWYPPGHGDIYNALLNSDILTDLLEKGIKYIFISNSFNYKDKSINYNINWDSSSISYPRTFRQKARRA